jgi:hypothetical protein
MWLKGCPRCRGDLLRQSDIYGSYVACLQCGHVLRPQEEARLKTEPEPVVATVNSAA